MKLGVWFYGLGTALAGILDIVWGTLDASHQPIQSLGSKLPGQHILAYAVGTWLVAAGFSILWQRYARLGSAACAIAYLSFVALWLIRYYAGIHALGWRIDVLGGVSFGLAQQLMLVAPAAILYASTLSPDSPLRKKATTGARWMLGVPPLVFGLLRGRGASHFFCCCFRRQLRPDFTCVVRTPCRRHWLWARCWLFLPVPFCSVQSG